MEVHQALKAIKIGVEAIPLIKQKGAHAHCTDTRIRTMSSQRALASQHNTRFKARLSCTDTRRSTMSSQRALASQHNTRDGLTPRSHTQCPPYRFVLCHVTLPIPFYFCCPSHATRCLRSVRSDTPRAPVASFPAGGLPRQTAPCLTGLWSRHRNTSQLLKRSLLPLIRARSALVRSSVLFGDILDVPRTRRTYV